MVRNAIQSAQEMFLCSVCPLALTVNHRGEGTKLAPAIRFRHFNWVNWKAEARRLPAQALNSQKSLYISPQRTPPRFRWIERLPNWPLFSDLLGLWLQTFSVQSQHNQRVRHISMMTFATHKSQRFTWFFLDQNTKYNDFKCTQTTPLLGWQPHPLVLALPHSQGVRFQQQSVPWNKDFRSEVV